MKINEKMFFKVILLVALALVLYYVIYMYNKQKQSVKSDKAVAEGFDGESELLSGTPTENVQASEQTNENYRAVNYEGTQYPNDCFPKDRLTAQDLLPEEANSVWSKTVPAGSGSVGDGNFLNAGYHVGVNTTGSSLRNPNLQLRSEPLNPKETVGPWLNSSIEPDTSRRPLEIDGSC